MTCLSHVTLDHAHRRNETWRRVVFQNSGNHHPESDAIKLQDLLDQSQAGPLRTLPRSSFFLTEARSKKCTFSYPLYSLPY